MNDEKGYLNIAKKDLEASQLLYKQQLYSQAIFYLQQSVEKTAKVYGIITNTVQPQKLKKISHNPTRIYRKQILEMKEKMKGLIKASNKFPKIKDTKILKGIDIQKHYNDIESTLKAFDSLNPKKLRVLSENDINSIGSLLEINHELEKGKQELESLSITDEELQEIKRSIIDSMEDIITAFGLPTETFEKDKVTIEQITKQKFEIFLRKSLAHIIDLLNTHISLLSLSVITFPHAVTTRYMDSDFNPLEFYTEDSNIIKVFEDLVEIMEGVLQRMEKYVNKSSDIQG